MFKTQYRAVYNVANEEWRIQWRIRMFGLLTVLWDEWSRGYPNDVMAEYAIRDVIYNAERRKATEWMP